MTNKRCKTLEYPWAGIKAGLTVNAYTAKCNNGKKYVVYAHDFNDQSMFLTKLDLQFGVSTRSRDCETHFEQRKMISYLPSKKGEPKKKPFWYRGRVYEFAEGEEKLTINPSSFIWEKDEEGNLYLSGLKKERPSFKNGWEGEE